MRGRWTVLKNVVRNGIKSGRGWLSKHVTGLWMCRPRHKYGARARDRVPGLSAAAPVY